MKQEKMEEILVLTRRIGNLFNEIMDITTQLAEAIDRRDEVSVSMIIAMRSEPIDKLAIADRALREQLDQLEEEDSQQIRAILNGNEECATDPLEKILAGQAAMNIRTHRKLLDLDKILNRKLAQEKSIYQ
ncbi:MAG: hypothetical protein IKM11_03685 [Oscillospiraceae bacterium]|nr:hypothetical protein [Oscillospiraceae bacterium]